MSAPAGWYPDPSGQRRRRYWDGVRWTDHLTDLEFVPPEPPRALITVLALFPLGLIAAALDPSRRGDDLVILLLFSALAILIVLAIWVSVRADKRRKWRQQMHDRSQGLAINADVEDAAYLQGDEHRGLHGQFPPRRVDPLTHPREGSEN
jgi:hypothetical protein